MTFPLFLPSLSLTGTFSVCTSTPGQRSLNKRRRAYIKLRGSSLGETLAGSSANWEAWGWEKKDSLAL